MSTFRQLTAAHLPVPAARRTGAVRERAPSSRSGAVTEVVLHPGECFIGNERFRVTTLLGSCVSVTLWHPAHRIGAISHSVYASRQGTHQHDLDGRYADEAVMLMLKRFAQLGVDPSECVAKLFGGGNMFPQHTRAGSVHVGERNGNVVRQMLRKLGIPVVSESLFGNGHRKIVFDIAEGVVWARHHAT